MSPQGAGGRWVAVSSRQLPIDHTAAGPVAYVPAASYGTGYETSYA